MKYINNKNLMMIFILPILFILFMGAANVLDRFHIIKAQDIQLVDNKGNLVYNLMEISKRMETFHDLNIEITNLETQIKSLEQRLNSYDVQLEEEIESNNIRLDDILSNLDDFIMKVTRKNDELDETIDQNHKDLKSSVRKINRDIKIVENKRIKPLETEIKVVSENKEKLEMLMRLPKIIDWLENLMKMEEFERQKEALQD